ncbi:MAG TPA: hypothetical protein VF729_05660 [Solirubrobacterales bacterium]
MTPSAFVDNTSVHHLLKALRAREEGRPLSATDAVILFQFAEHIMLCDKLLLSGFEPPATVELTQLVIAKMQSDGYTDLGGNEDFMISVQFSEEQYAAACRAAAPNIVQDLTSMGNTVRGLGRLANDLTRPTPTKNPPMVKWLERTWDQAERQEVGESALAERSSIGAYDYVVAGSEELYELLQGIGTAVDGEERRAVAAAVGVFFRSAINQELATQLQTYYTPAPQRARIVHEADQSFLRALEETITKIALDSKLGLESDFLGRAWAEDRLPLPIFALHFLRKGAGGKDADVLAVAHDLRDDRDVAAVRSWLVDWEAKFASREIEERRKAREELEQIARELGVKLGSVDDDYTALLSVSASVDAFGTVSVNPDLPGKMRMLTERMRFRNRRRRLFIAAIATDIARGGLGRDVMRLLDPRIE